MSDDDASGTTDGAPDADTGESATPEEGGETGGVEEPGGAETAGSAEPGPADDAFSAEPVDAGTDAASPFDELASGPGDSGPEDVDFDRLFDELSAGEETGEIDGERVWAELEDQGVEDTEASGEEHVVPAREFCAQCEHVADPPDVRCTYEGSEIVEFVDRDTVRVRGCPIVARRREIGRMD